MGHQFAQIAFTPGVRAVQAANGSRDAYAALDAGVPTDAVLGPRERDFIAARDSLYMASVGETGWPYVQHRGGPPGFVRALDERTIGFADYRGNRQYVSVGNLLHDERVALIFVDYPNRRRLKLLGRASMADDDAVHREWLPTRARARVERVMRIRVAAFDWNCPQHITPRYSAAEMEALIAPLKARIAELESR